MNNNNHIAGGIILIAAVLTTAFWAVVSCDTHHITDLLGEKKKSVEVATPVTTPGTSTDDPDTPGPTPPPGRYPDPPSNPYPPDGQTGVDINTTLGVDVSDPDGDAMNVTFYGKKSSAAGTYNEILTPTLIPSGDRAEAQWFGLSYSTEYEWYTAACDQSDRCTQTEIFRFTTKSSPTPTPSPPPLPVWNPVPSDGETGVCNNVDLGVNVNTGDGLAIKFMGREGNTENNFSYIGTDTAAQGYQASVEWKNLENSTTYEWYAASDGYADSGIWSFTTRENHAPDKPTGLHPSFTYTGSNPALRATVSDPDGDRMDVTFYGKPRGAPVPYSNIGTDYYVGSGGQASITWTDLSYLTEYEWYVEVCDVCGVCTSSDIVPFTTESNKDPNVPTNPVPANGATGVALDVTLRVDVSDPNGDTMDVTFYDMMNGIIGIDENVSSGRTAHVEWNGLAPNSPYAWHAVADDGEKSTQSPQWSFRTIDNSPTPDPGQTAVYCELSQYEVLVHLRNEPSPLGETHIMEFNIGADQTVTNIRGVDAKDWNQDGSHVTVSFTCVTGPEFVVEGIDSIPTGFELDGASIPLVD